MSLKQFLNKVKNSFPIIGFIVSVESLRLAYAERQARLEIVKSELTKLTEELQNKEDLIINHNRLVERIGNLTNKGSGHIDSIVNNRSTLQLLSNRLKNENISQEERDFIEKTLDSLNTNQAESVEQVKGVLEELRDIFSGPSNNFFNPFDSFHESIEVFKNFLSTLQIEQIISVAHLCAILFLFSCLFSIVSVIFGDFLIKHLKLEDKYPKVAIYIQIRRKFQRYYLILDIGLIFTMLIALTLLNIYILINPIFFLI